MIPVASPSPDYIPGHEEPQTPPTPQDEDEHELMFIQPHDPDFVPEPIYPEYIPLEDEHILPAKEQPLPPVVLPTTESPGYVAESNPEEDPKEYEEDEAEDIRVDYPMDRGDDEDDEGDGDSSGYDADIKDEDEEEEEEEHLALAESAVDYYPTTDFHIPSTRGRDMLEASSVVTYTSVYTDSKPKRLFWGADEELSDGGSSRVIVYRYDGLLMMPVASPSPDYIPGHEEPQTPPTPQDEDEHELMFIQPHDPDFVPEPIYPEYILLEDEHILPAKEQPLPPVVLPTTESP
nr:hypothetical protein [Tanacetum cinerariifolium]